MTNQEILTFLIDAIALSFAALLITQFVSGLIPLVRKNFTNATKKLSLTAFDIAKIFDVDSGAENFSPLPDPWFLAIDSVVQETASPSAAVEQFQRPLLLLPPAKDIAERLSTSTDTTFDRLSAIESLDKLSLRTARKIANALKIVQKLDKKDKSLSSLRSEIKAKLLQPQLLPKNTVDVVCELIAC